MATWLQASPLKDADPYWYVLSYGPFHTVSLRKIDANRKKTSKKMHGVLEWGTNDLTDAFGERDEHSPGFQDLHKWVFSDGVDPIDILRRIADDIEQVRVAMQDLGYASFGHEGTGFQWFCKELAFADVTGEISRVFDAFAHYGSGVWTREYDPRAWHRRRQPKGR